MTAMLDLMDALADAIRAALDDVDFPVQVEPRMIFNPTPLSIDIYPGAIARETETAGFGDLSGGYVFTVRARINKDDTDAMQDVLLALMDDENDLCLGAAIVGDPTLGSLAETIDVTDPSGFLAFDPHVGVTWTVMVVAA